jgi:hypothetical protein
MILLTISELDRKLYLNLGTVVTPLYVYRLPEILLQKLMTSRFI